MLEASHAHVTSAVRSKTNARARGKCCKYIDAHSKKGNKSCVKSVPVLANCYLVSSGQIRKPVDIKIDFVY
jgi:hypothetical protein